MLYYVSVFILCLVFYILHKGAKSNSAKKAIEIITLIVLILLSGTRYRLGGWDYNIYENIFKAAPPLSEFSFSVTNQYDTEIGYILLNSIVKSFGFNFYGFTLIHSILFYTLLYKALKRFDIDFSYFIIIFLYKCCIFNTFVSMRQSLVLVIFLNAVYFLIKGNTKKYLLCIIPCIFLHISSVVLIPLIFIRKLNFSKKGLIIYGLIFLAFLALNLMGIFVFNPTDLIVNIFGNSAKIMSKTEAYLVGNSSALNILSSIETFGVWLLIVIFYNKVYKNASHERKMIINLFLLIIPMVSLLRSFEIITRFRDYFSIFFPFVIYYISTIFGRNNRFFYNSLIFLLCFVGFYRYIYTYDSGDYALKNYQSYLTKGVSIFGNE